MVQVEKYQNNVYHMTSRLGVIQRHAIQTKDHYFSAFEPGSDRRDILAIKVKSEIFTEKVRPSCCEQLQKI